MGARITSIPSDVQTRIPSDSPWAKYPKTLGLVGAGAIVLALLLSLLTGSGSHGDAHGSGLIEGTAIAAENAEDKDHGSAAGEHGETDHGSGSDGHGDEAAHGAAAGHGDGSHGEDHGHHGPTSSLARFHFSFLTAFMWGLSIALGGLFFVIVQFLAKAGWSVVVRRIAENVMGTLPLFAGLFVLVAMGFSQTHFHWWTYEVGSGDPILDHKAPYLDQTFFFMRAVFYVAVWVGFAYAFRKWSTEQDQSGDHELTRRMQWWSAPALLLFALTITFAAVDWMKSMEPHWFSTMWGVYYFAGSTVSIFAMLAVLVLWLQRDGLVKKIINTEHYHDIGKLLFGFVVFWTYIAFSQYMLIWYANLPEETLWYEHRTHHGWETVGIMLMIGHFFIPFFFLLPRGIKRNPATLLIGAVWMLTIHYVDLYFIIMPVLDTQGPQPSLIDALTLVGVFALFLAAFAYVASKNELVPVKDPRLPESLRFENF